MAAAALGVCLAIAPVHANDHYEQMAKALLAELIAIDTTHDTGDATAAANLLADRLLAAGFDPADVQVIESAPKKGNLVARLRSPNPQKKPILLLAHIDVVAAHPEDWSVPPFQLTEKDGMWYGRGVADDKDEAAIHTVNLIRWKDTGFRPNRDIIVALTADEEGGPNNGAEYLLQHHRDLVDAAFVINEGGGGVLEDGRHLTNGVQAAEKVYQSFTLEVTNPGGHSSRPRRDNAIYQLAHALTAVEAYQFPVEFNEVTRANLRQGKITMPPERAAAVDALLQDVNDAQALAVLAAEPAYNALLRTTCVATQLAAGHAENALPQRATATVNCRMMPGSNPDDVQAALARAISDDDVRITKVQIARPSPASPLTEEVMDPIYRITEDMWPGTVVVPTMSTGATDSFFFRNAGIPAYGTSGIFYDIAGSNAHGRDEHVQPQSFYDGLEYLNRLVKAYASN